MSTNRRTLMTRIPPISTRGHWLSCAGYSFILLGLVLLGSACRQSGPQVQSYLEGRITVASHVDTSSDYSNFRVLAIRAEGRRIDTLGHAVTDREGRFRTTVSAPEQGIYSLTVWGRRGEERLGTTNYVVAPGDSGTLTAELPLERPLRVDSPENLALLGYQNTMSMHRRMLTRRLQTGTSRPTALVQSIRQSSSILWSLQDNYPGTYASQIAAVESISLLEGWNDSLVVARARQIDPTNPRFLDAARLARRAEAHLRGQRAALDLLDSFEARATTSEQQAGVQALRIQAFLDSAQTEAALSAAQRLKSDHPHTQWAEWANRAQYEAEHLMPGMTAPDLTFRTLSGDSLSLQTLRGHPVILEYYRPGNDTYERQLAARNATYDSTRADSVSFVSISTEPDSIVNRTYLNDLNPPGHQVIAPKGPDDPLVRRYNVVDVPTHFLIDAEGRIVGQYQSSSLLTLRLDLAELLGEESSPPPS